MCIYRCAFVGLYVMFNSKYALTDFDNSFISVLEYFSKFMFFLFVTDEGKNHIPLFKPRRSADSTRN